MGDANSNRPISSLNTIDDSEPNPSTQPHRNNLNTSDKLSSLTNNLSCNLNKNTTTQDKLNQVCSFSPDENNAFEFANNLNMPKSSSSTNSNQDEENLDLDIEYKLGSNSKTKLAEDYDEYNLFSLDEFSDKLALTLTVDEVKPSNKSDSVKINNYDDYIDEDLAPNQLNISTSLDDNELIKEQSEKEELEEEEVAEVKQIELIMDDSSSTAENTETGEHIQEAKSLIEDTNEAASLKYESLSSIEDNSNKNSSKVQALACKLPEITLPADKQPELIATEPDKNEISANLNTSLRQAFIWSESEAVDKQHEQTNASGCGATVILNVLKALNYPFDYESVCAQVKINQRIPESLASVTTLAQYLFSRSVAGMNASELIENIENVTQNKVSGRFFAFYPPRDINLTQWLIYWIHKGAIPSALLNLQKFSIWGYVPDAWHHQMVYACDSDSVYLTNPLESKSIDAIMTELTSDSVLLVRSSDVIKRFNANSSSLVELVSMSHHSAREKKRWFDMNVLGQCLSVLRDYKSKSESSSANLSSVLNSSLSMLRENEVENAEGNNEDEPANYYEFNAVLNAQQASSGAFSLNNTSAYNPSITHISIPASYVPGITLFAYRESSLFKEIMSACELPLAQANLK